MPRSNLLPSQGANALGSFIAAHIDELLESWDAFARTLAKGRPIEQAALRDHAREMLLAVADDMAGGQTDQQQHDKSEGLRPENAPALTSAARLHGTGRLDNAFSMNELVLELRALRASVLRHLAAADIAVSVLEVTRFNEAIDQILAESIDSFLLKLDDVRRLERESELRRRLLLHSDAAQEKDRRRIARELHDSLGQKLVAMSLQVARLRQVCGSDVSADTFNDLSTLIAEADRELDQAVFELRPLGLEHGLLADALSMHLQKWSAMSGVGHDLLTEGLEETSDDVQATIFRVVQEALNNVAKHAKATQVQVAVICRGGAVNVAIEDDGVGINPDDATLDGRGSFKGWGIAGMRERVEALSGQLTYERTTRGTSLLAHFPAR